jgi:hypothetical protein
MENFGVYRHENGIIPDSQEDIKKNEIKPWQSREWCIQARGESDFIAAMEDVLDVYARKYDQRRPLVCMDEIPRQLIGEARLPIPAEPGKPERYDTEYIRNGTCTIFMFVAPLEGWRRAEATERRTRADWALQIKKLITVDFPDAEKIVLVMDNLDIHSMGSLYKAFPPEEAKRLREKLEVHYTPKHGSWLNMAEIENNVLINHGLSKRVPTMEQVEKEVAAWSVARNRSSSKINWRFTAEKARIKLKRLYPQF